MIQCVDHAMNPLDLEKHPIGEERSFILRVSNVLIVGKCFLHRINCVTSNPIFIAPPVIPEKSLQWLLVIAASVDKL